jgi:membrane glycosyltransferase
MLIQSRFVFDVLAGRDSGWNAQNRLDAAMPFQVVLRRHWLHVGTGLLFGSLAFAVSWAAFFWFMPIMAGLLASPVISWASGLPPLGRRLWRANVFRIPEEQSRPVVALEAREAVPLLQAAE